MSGRRGGWGGCWAVGLVGLAVGLSGCSKEGLMAVIGRKADAAKKDAPDPIVATDVPVTREVREYEEFVGQMMAENTVEVRARVTGYLDKVNFVDGSEVAKDGVLFEIDPRPYEAEVARTLATIEQGEAHARRLEADLRRAQALKARDAISREDFDKVVADTAEAEAGLGILKANHDLARLNLAFTRVTAPIAGRISRRMVDQGNLVKADETMMTTIVSLDPMYVYFDVDERTLLKIRRLIREGKMKSREQAAVTVDAALADDPVGTFPYKGQINFSENRIDPGTGTLRVRAVLANPKPAGSALGLRVFSPGLFMRVRLPIGEPRKALLLPEKAMVTNQGEKSIFVVEPDPAKPDATIARKRKVEIGALHDGLRVIESGLAEGERVVVEGLQRIGVPKVDPETRKPIYPRVAPRPASPPAPLVASKAEPGPAAPAASAAPAVAKKTPAE